MSVLGILPEGQFRSASERLLGILNKFLPMNTLFVALNDGVTNQIIKARNQNETMVTEGAVPYNETYCAQVCEYESDVLIIGDTTKDLITADMKVTNQLGATTFIGVPITLKDGSKVGTVCGMDRNTHLFTTAEIELLMGAAAFLAYVIELEYSVYTDALTGTYSRKYVDQIFDMWLPQYSRIAMIMLNIGKMELFNGFDGYEIGEQKLRAIAHRIRNAVHATDVVARISTTEFIVLTHQTVDNSDLHQLGEDILSQFSSPLSVEGDTVFLSPHIGVAVFSAHAQNLQDLFKYATSAMYMASTTRERIAFYYPQNASWMDRRREISNSLHQAVENDAFELFYQPKFHTEEHTEPISTEALVRWKHGSEWIPPSEFIPIAEDTGLINKIGKWVLYEACRQNKAWQTTGHASMVVSVNISPRQFDMGDVYGDIVEVLCKTGLEPQWLAIEITEGLLMQNSTEIAEELRSIRELGVRIAIDDFGKGYSSLSYLLHFEPTHLKIDQFFIQEMLEDEGYMKIVSATINLAHNLGMRVIAEGVETHEQLKKLRILGCDMVQGYLLSRPLPPTQFEERFLRTSVN